MVHCTLRVLALLARLEQGIGLIIQTPRRGYMSVQLPYVNAMIEVAQYYSIPCLDLNRSSGLYPDPVYYYTNYFTTRILIFMDCIQTRLVIQLSRVRFCSLSKN